MSIFEESNSWPFLEAKRILKRIDNKIPDKGYVLFETGYGPSGLPHIGTFGEVARTSMVMNAFKKMSDIPVKLIAFSDDMDGLRKVPDNLPNKEMILANLGKPLSVIPDPFGEKESFAAYMNNKLIEFLDKFGFEYEFASATNYYKSGKFDQALKNALKKYDEIMKIMLPTLGEERQASYSPFLPISPETGIVLQVPIYDIDVNKSTFKFLAESGKEYEIYVGSGNVKMQWKADWALRWYSLGVDYEMHGKDLIPSALLSSKICKILGSNPPELFNYELFLDENGQKISKSKGNGITIDEWLKYAPTESLSLFMYQSPQRAKKLYFDVIPKQVDEYLTFIKKYEEEAELARLNNPVYHVHLGNPPKIPNSNISFNLLLNLVCACNTEDKNTLWGFLSRYDQSINPANAKFLDRLVDFAIVYYNDFIKPNKKYRKPEELELKTLKLLVENLNKLASNSSSQEIQQIVYDTAKINYSEADLKNFFKSFYEIVLGQEQGPRIGSFISLFGINESIQLIKTSLL